MMSESIQEVFARLKYRRDDRRPPDERRRGQFRAGWHDATKRGEIYAGGTLERLTWRNLGYRFGQHFGSQKPEQLDEVFDNLARLYDGQHSQDPAPLDAAATPSAWWFGVNNSRGSRADGSSGHIHYRDIAGFLRGEEETFSWPYGGAPGSQRLYPQMQTGDGVAFWMGDGVEKDWGIIGFGRIVENRAAARLVVIARETARIAGLTPYPAGTPTHTEETKYLRQLFGPHFRPLLKMYIRLGFQDVKPRVITIESISAAQHQALLDRARAVAGTPRHLDRPGADSSAGEGVLHSGDKQIGPPYQWSKTLTVQDYVAGLKAIESQASDLQRRLLVNQYHAPKRTVFATELARMAMVPGGHPIVNAQYGRLAHMFSDATGHEPDRRRSGKPRWWSIWSRGYPTRKGFIWELLPAVAEALEVLGWVVPSEGTVTATADSVTRREPWRSRLGTTALRPESTVLRGATEGGEVRQIHNRLQNTLFERLRGEFGVDAVEMESDFTDLKVRRADGSVDLYEVKSDRCPRVAIRAALGQLLEYSYVAKARGERVRSIVVVAPNPLDNQDAAYLAYLCQLLQLDLRYLQICDDEAEGHETASASAVQQGV